jgi:hypothetical protein
MTNNNKEDVSMQKEGTTTQYAAQELEGASLKESTQSDLLSDTQEIVHYTIEPKEGNSCPPSPKYKW